MISRTLLITTLTVLASTSAFADNAISFHAETSYPEGVSWSAEQQRFFVSSVRKGTVGTVTLDGDYTAVIDDERLVSSVGLLVDDSRNTLWVANSDPGAGERTVTANQGKLAGVAQFNATTGELVAYHDLGELSDGYHFANDIALDANGNAYVTDSFAPIIYRISTSGQASIFAQSPLFMDAEGFNLNGIAYHPGGYLLVGKYNSGTLFKVSIANPTEISEVEIAESLIGVDGFNLVDAEHLVAVVNLGVDKTVELTSADGWNSASVTREKASTLSMPTAATRMGDQVWVLNARLDTLFDPNAQKVSDYLLQLF